MESGQSRQNFQRCVFACYEAAHEALKGSQSVAKAQPEEANGALRGQFVVADSLTGMGTCLPLATSIAGGCFLGVDEDAEAARDMLRHGHCDFVVNSLDEALRILKNELRQKKPVSVWLIGSSSQATQQMADRGVAPQLFFHKQASAEHPALQRLQRYGSCLQTIEWMEQFLDRAATEQGVVTSWALPRGNTSMLARLDALAHGLVPAEDQVRRRWLEAAAQYVPREVPPQRVASLTSQELERFLDGISARLMSLDIAGPVQLAIGDQSMTLG